MPTEVATVVVETTRTVQIEVPGPAYSNARVAAYLQGILTANGDLLVVAGGVLARVGVGSSGQVLTVSGGAPTWAAPTGFANPMTHAGDLIVGGSSGAPTRLGKGTNGQVLTMSGSDVVWASPAATYTDAQAIAAIAGEATDHQLIQRQSGTSLQGISLSTIYDGAVDQIEALGNGVLVTTSGTLDNVSGTNGQVLTHNGTTWVAAAPSGGFSNPMTTLGDLITGGVSGAAQRLGVGSEGQVLKVVSGVPAWGADAGMSNPMTTEWDLILGGSSGTPTRLGVGANFDVVGVKADGTVAYCPQTAGFGRMPARYSLAIADGNATPVMFGWTTAVTRVHTSSANGVRVARTGGAALHRQSTSTAANQWAGWTLATSVSSTIAPYGSSSAILRADESASSAYAYGLIVGTTALNGATGPYFNAAPTTFACYGLRWRPATQTTWHLIMYDGTTFTETDTGVTVTANSSATATGGSTHGLVVCRDGSGVRWEIWNELTSPPTLLGSGRTSSNVPTTFANALAVYSGFGSNGASATGQTNMLGFTTLTAGGHF